MSMKMVSLVDHHEQQFAVITAEITTEIGRLKNPPPGGVQVSQLTVKQNLERLFEEASETLEQIELEARQLPDANAKNRYQTHVKAYRTELTRLDGEMKQALSPAAANERLLAQSNFPFAADDGDGFYSDQRATLLSGNSRLVEQNKKLTYGRQMVEETTQIGNQALEDLGNQRETILGARERIRETDHVLGKSSNLLTRMLIRAHSQRAMLICLFLIAAVTVAVTFYLVVIRRRHSSSYSLSETTPTVSTGASPLSSTLFSTSTLSSSTTAPSVLSQPSNYNNLSES